MNEVFNPTRFRRLFVKHTMEHYRTYLMSISVLAGVFVVGGTFVFYVLDRPPEVGFQISLYIVLLFLSGAIFTSTVFADFGDKTKAIPALTLPATALEKFLVGWLYSYLIFLIVYTVVFYLALYGLSSIRHWSGHERFYMMDIRYAGVGYIFVLFSVMQALVLYGAIFFRKLHFIKTGFAFFIGLGIVTVINTLFLQFITGLKEVRLAVPFGFLAFTTDNHTYWIRSKESDSVVVAYFLAAIALTLWAAAYFRLKEKQV